MLETDVRTERATPYRRWIAACAAAEAIGMTAAAGAATWANDMTGPAALTVVVAGGLVEGTALGVAQGTVLARVAPRLSRVRYLAATVLVAGLGWAVASAPAVLGDGGGAEAPPMLLVLLGAVVLGGVLGTVLGAAQAYALRGVVRHPRRWVVANAAAWPLTMALIYVGATLPDAGWAAVSVLVTGAITGAVAGAALGLVTGLFLPTLSGVSASSRAVLALLSSPRPLGLQRALIGLGLRGRSSGRRYRFPVQYAVAPGGLALLPGRPSQKTWWRNIDPRPTQVEVLREGVWAPASARRLGPGDDEYDAVLAAYVARWPDTDPAPDQPIVLVQLGRVVARP